MATSVFLMISRVKGSTRGAARPGAPRPRVREHPGHVGRERRLRVRRVLEGQNQTDRLAGQLRDDPVPDPVRRERPQADNQRADRGIERRGGDERCPEALRQVGAGGKLGAQENHLPEMPIAVGRDLGERRH